MDFSWSGWAGVGALGQVAAAAIALLGVPFIWWQIRSATRSADFEHLINVFSTVSGREDALIRAPTAEEKHKAFFEFANLLEVFAAALNDGLLTSSTRRIARDKLIDSIVAIEAATDWYPVIEKGLTGPATWEELAKFMRRERRAIDAARKRRSEATTRQTAEVDSVANVV